MAFVNATFNEFEFKRQEFSKTFTEALKLEIRNAAREFVKTALEKIPIRTGFARGGLLNLEAAIGISASSHPTAFIKAFNKRARSLKFAGPRAQEYYKSAGGRQVLKTPQNARAYSTPMNKIFTVINNVYYFNYNITISYFTLNDFFAHSRVPSAPWKSFTLGRISFLAYLRTKGIKKLPAIKSYILQTEVRVERSIRRGSPKVTEKIQ